MKRVVVIGAPGSGKTTFSQMLARKLTATYVELDAILHGEGGREPSSEEFRARLLPLLEREPWVVDGLRQAERFQAVEWVHVRRSSEALAWIDARCC